MSGPRIGAVVAKMLGIDPTKVTSLELRCDSDGYDTVTVEVLAVGGDYEHQTHRYRIEPLTDPAPTEVVSP